MSFVDDLYAASIWKMGFIISSIVVGGSLTTLLIVDRLWSREKRREHNDVAGFLIAVVGVIFAILVSSLTVIVITRRDGAHELVVQEAQTLNMIARGADLVVPERGTKLRREVLDYLDAAIDQEWPAMREGRWLKSETAGGNQLWTEIATLPVENLSQMLTAQNLRGEVDRLLEIRDRRAEIATTGVDRVVWAVVLLGSGLTILFAILFGMPNFVAHVVMTTLLSFTVALAMIMVMAIDWPYIGHDSVQPDHLEQLREALVRRVDRSTPVSLRTSTPAPR